jgi:di/tricarboxylate transporter
MPADAWFTLAVIAAVVAVLVRDWLPPVTTVLGAVVVLLVAGVIEPDQAFSGFSNPAPITVAALYVVAAGVERAGLVGPVVARLLGGGGGRRNLARLCVPAAGASSVLNNTPIVAMLIPTVDNWADRSKQPISRYLMPLSFATILGGVVTTLGTSTNLVVSGLLEDAGEDALDLFELSPVGLPVAVIGVLTVILLAPHLLPDRRGPRRSLSDDEAREFVVRMRVEPGGPLDGQTVESGGLRHLQGVFLVEVDRDEQRIAPVAPDAVLRGGDELTFVGRADLVIDLQRQRGLVSSEQYHLTEVDDGSHTFFEAVIGADSPLVGRTLKEVEFRARYQAAVVAIHRAGQRVNAKLGEVRLRVGDTLLLLAGPDFRTQWGDRRDFLLVSRLGGPAPSATRKAPFAGAVLTGVVVLAATGVLPILEAALVGAVATVALGVLTAEQARDAVDLNVVVLIAAAFGLGAAAETSGLAAELASGLVEMFDGFGDRGVLLGIVLATVILTELITNNAAAVLMFPIALPAGAEAGMDPRHVAIAVAIAASASFLTPIGYQTNTMVYGPGGYRFSDYVRLGTPLTVVVIAVVVGVVPTL